jgi:hypothetical protein
VWQVAAVKRSSEGVRKGRRRARARGGGGRCRRLGRAEEEEVEERMGAEGGRGGLAEEGEGW